MKTIYFKIISIFFLFLSISLFASPLYIVHTNDFHGHYFNKGKCIIAQIADLEKLIKNNYENVLVLDAGDVISGSIYTNLDKGESMANIYSKLPLDFMTLGNHEFDYDSPRLQTLFKKYNLHVIDSNVEIKKGKKFFLPWKIINIDGKKIGIFGLTTPETSKLSNPSCVKNYIFNDIIKTSQEMVSVLKKNNADLIIVLSHCGYNSDCELANKVKGINLIIGAHTHTVLKHPVRIGNTAIVQTGAYGKYIGILKIEFLKKPFISGGLIPIKSYISEDKTIKKIAIDSSVEVRKMMKRKICEINTDLPAGNIRQGESKLGNFIADNIRLASNADIVILNAGGIRYSLNKGKITGEDIYNCLPFGNKASFIKANAELLKKIILHGLSGLFNPNNAGRFPVISGLRIKAQFYKNKIKNIKLFIKNKPIDNKKEYLILLPDYLKKGGDGYSILKNIKGVYTKDSGIDLREILIKGLKSSQMIAPIRDGRIDVKTSSI